MLFEVVAPLQVRTTAVLAAAEEEAVGTALEIGTMLKTREALEIEEALENGAALEVGTAFEAVTVEALLLLLLLLLLIKAEETKLAGEPAGVAEAEPDSTDEVLLPAEASTYAPQTPEFDCAAPLLDLR